MRYEIEITEEAESDLDVIRAFYREEILKGMEDHLRFEPTRKSRSRIKRLELLDSPAYRLRVGDYRVFYDVDEVTAEVTVLRVMSKEESLAYLETLEQML
ncbi:MAG: type II toxin-antitoxin system RelE/ParE family toxin [Anaerolineae bacterium]